MTLHSSSSSTVKFRKNTRRIFMNECDEIATSVLVRIEARLQHIVTCEWSTAVGAWCAKHTLARIAMSCSLLAAACCVNTRSRQCAFSMCPQRSLVGVVSFSKHIAHTNGSCVRRCVGHDGGRGRGARAKNHTFHTGQTLHK